ncbi:hypothetical protein HMPREF1544_10106 [Mucor circinelloides 1006PhL]|uniref:Uncharacterized protein n=1 Tax=Mucor circinelloides f. circinelloides (strain 1006PhL) TaxID=1220926 RepID=S2IZC0_MUCC1|nr:hypothetical protein HMPREF1544_10106 [Mucor circinelloides 1006PhL]
MPINKSNFQPKDARAISMSYRDEDEDDMSDLFPNEKSSPSNGRKMMTGTQALVEFLKTTSPEEFQRSTPERSVNNLFSRIRKPKRNTAPPPPASIIPTPSLSSRSVPSSTASLPVTLASTLTAPTSYHGSDVISNHTIHRKNYIEIVPQQQHQKMVTKSAGNSRSPSFDTTSIQSFVLRNNSTSTNNNNNNNNKTGEPILPNKKRESSLYSGSLRHSVSIKSQLSAATNSNRATRPLIRDTSQRLDVKATEEFLSLADGMDSIESALLQRLERIRIVDGDIPSDQVAAGLATEHVRALGITHTLDNQHHLDHDKRKVRHMQVQTENTCISSNEQQHLAQDTPTNNIPLHEPSTPEDLEARARRAEVALEDALDHFEVISGLAYKKLRELWEEKMRWENACMELRDRLVVMEQRRYPFQQQQHQQQSLHNQGNDQGHGIMRDDYFLEENEEEDELGLSEFPCSEN